MMLVTPCIWVPSQESIEVSRYIGDKDQLGRAIKTGTYIDRRESSAISIEGGIIEISKLFCD